MLSLYFQHFLFMLATVGIVVGLSASKVSAVTINDAEVQVARVLGQSVTWTSAGVGQSCHRVTVMLDSASTSAAIDNQTGLLIKYNNKTFPSPQTGAPALTLSDAQSRASFFMQSVGVSLAAPWFQSTAIYMDHGSGWREYAFSWKKIVQGIHLPASIDVAIDADSGQVRSYMLIDDAVTISLVPTMSANNAAIAVAQNQNIVNPVVQSAFLTIWYHPVYFDYTTGQPGVQTLYWEITLQDPNATSGSTSTVIARVDANTGSVETILETPSISHHSLAPHKKADKSKGSTKKSGSRVSFIRLLPHMDKQDLKHTKLPPTVFQLASLKRKTK